MTEPDPEEINSRANEKAKKRKQARDKMLATKTIEKGLLIVHTGKGKGQTTGALGLAAKATGPGSAAVRDERPLLREVAAAAPQASPAARGGGGQGGRRRPAAPAGPRRGGRRIRGLRAGRAASGAGRLGRGPGGGGRRRRARSA